MQLKLGAIGEIVEGIEDLRQRIRIVLETPKGFDPHRPEFGSNIWQWLDKPFTIAMPNVIAEAYEAIEKWIPDFKLTQVKVVKADPNGGFSFVIRGLWNGEEVEVEV
ncbi:MAG: GPW/gp25 family protein [Desulfurobacteriaceae bacterium]